MSHPRIPPPFASRASGNLQRPGGDLPAAAIPIADLPRSASSPGEFIPGEPPPFMRPPSHAGHVEPPPVVIEPPVGLALPVERAPVYISPTEVVMSLPADAEEEETEFALQPYHGKTREQIAAELNALERLQQAQAELAKRLAKEQAADAHWLGISFGKMQFSLTGLLLATFVMGLGIVITRLLISNLSLQVVSYLLLMGIALCAAALRERESAFLLSLMQVLLFAYALSLLCGWALM